MTAQNPPQPIKLDYWKLVQFRTVGELQLSWRPEGEPHQTIYVLECSACRALIVDREHNRADHAWEAHQAQ